MKKPTNLREALVALSLELKKTGDGASSLGCDPRCKATARIRSQAWAGGKGSVAKDIDKLLKQFPADE
jgi:hypothetical protein